MPGDGLTALDFVRRSRALPGTFKNSGNFRSPAWCPFAIAASMLSQSPPRTARSSDASTPSIALATSGRQAGRQRQPSGLTRNNVVQPDVLLAPRTSSRRPGRASAPTPASRACRRSIVEIATSSAAVSDLHDKLRVYRRHRVRSMSSAQVLAASWTGGAALKGSTYPRARTRCAWRLCQPIFGISARTEGRVSDVARVGEIHRPAVPIDAASRL